MVLERVRCSQLTCQLLPSFCSSSTFQAELDSGKLCFANPEFFRPGAHRTGQHGCPSETADSVRTALRKEGTGRRPGFLTLQPQLPSFFKIPSAIFSPKSTAQTWCLLSTSNTGWSPASDPLSDQLSECSVCTGLALGCWETGSLSFPFPSPAEEWRPCLSR